MSHHPVSVVEIRPRSREKRRSFVFIQNKRLPNSATTKQKTTKNQTRTKNSGNQNKLQDVKPGRLYVKFYPTAGFFDMVLTLKQRKPAAP
jgi:hypothetical protein